MNEPSPPEAWGAIEPEEIGSPQPPPNTRAEYLVSWRRVGWPYPRRQVFHTYAKATAYRAKLEQGERRAGSGIYDQILVTIHRRDTRPWREIP